MEINDVSELIMLNLGVETRTPKMFENLKNALIISGTKDEMLKYVDRIFPREFAHAQPMPLEAIKQLLENYYTEKR